MNSRSLRPNTLIQLGLAALALSLPAARLAYSQQTVGATFGNVIKVPGGTPSDVVLDEARQRLYLINNTTSLVYIFDYTTNQNLLSPHCRARLSASYSPARKPSSSLPSWASPPAPTYPPPRSPSCSDTPPPANSVR